MLRITTVGLLITQGVVTSLALAQGVASTPGEPAPRSGYKVAFLYDRTRPTPTFQYQVYDLGKGQYDHQAVSRWLDVIKARFPDYAAYIKDIPTGHEPGTDERAALMTAIAQEKQKVESTFLRALTNEPTRPPTDYERLMHPSISGYNPNPVRSTGRSVFSSPLGGSWRFEYAPPSPSYPSSPFPYPYPRPHP
ncbi:hypothetical protein SAMN05444166_8125 [Singulisphaera sp. GP187]|uniref:hypothetical protein n=1 Tax=Singulisphaera sp. GP187 TaxID=1882752 RepID=UPI000928597E|nr:hypothetical protein [Singulisphaera sp. GP187]SIO66550.1 hypothetical protein SAMN05444166_8125 [Singulisphaera sp. GP187]